MIKRNLMSRKPLINAVFKLVQPGLPLPPNQVLFHVPRNFAKPEIANYLRQLYGMNVLKVNVANYAARIRGKRKRPAFKKAFVTIEE